MEELKNLFINSTLIKLEEDLAYLKRMYREEKDKVTKVVSEKKLLEGFWGTLKRMIEGIYRSISSKYLQRYVDEAVYRYNTRKMDGCNCFRDMFAASIGVVNYQTVKMVV